MKIDNFKIEYKRDIAFLLGFIAAIYAKQYDYAFGLMGVYLGITGYGAAKKLG